MSTRPKILLSAYACRPKGGSEPGAGWAWAKAAARDHDVWLITRGKFAHEITEELAVRPITRTSTGTTRCGSGWPGRPPGGCTPSTPSTSSTT